RPTFSPSPAGGRGGFFFEERFMRYVRFGLVAGAVAAVVATWLTGCGGVIDKEDEPPSRPGRGKRGAGQAIATVAKLEKVAGDYKGVIKGVVKWEGAPPDAQAKAATDRIKETM